MQSGCTDTDTDEVKAGYNPSNYILFYLHPDALIYFYGNTSFCPRRRQSLQVANKKNIFNLPI